MLIDTTRRANSVEKENSERTNPTKKTKIPKSFTFDPAFWEEVEEFRFKNRFPSATALVTKALEEYVKKLEGEK